jgi:glyoxylase-like metal-dependent hydrolase (beta-lactamase superfamily II)
MTPRVRRAIPSLCAGLLAVLVGAPALHAEQAPPFQQVHCLKYAEGRAPIEALARGAKPAVEIDIPMVICVARRPDQVIVLDAGYVDEAYGAGWGITTWTDLAERLGDLGVEPEQVDLVTISHMHWDHAGGTNRFPRARFVMQRRELEYAALDLPGNPFVKDGFRIEETLDAIRLKWDGRLELVDGDAEGWEPGLDLYLTPGHTAGTMTVCLDTVQGRVCYSSDAVYLYRNLAENLPLGIAVLPTEMFESYRKIQRVLRGGKLVPGHDMEIFSAAEKHGFRRVSERVVAIVE